MLGKILFFTGLVLAPSAWAREYKVNPEFVSFICGYGNGQPVLQTYIKDFLVATEYEPNCVERTNKLKNGLAIIKNAGNFVDIAFNEKGLLVKFALGTPPEGATVERQNSRLNEVRKFSCEFIEGVSPARTVNLDNCSSGILISPVRCTDELGGTITATVACPSRRNVDAKECYQQSMSQAYVRKIDTLRDDRLNKNVGGAQ